jgi:peroxiredoxin Q/BCP
MKITFGISCFVLQAALALAGRVDPAGGQSPAEGVLQAGSPAPDFTLPDQAGKDYTLSQFKGEKNVVLYFYPKDDTPGCTKEACGFRDLSSVFDSLGTAILGVSVDDTDSHSRFAREYNLDFPLLSDTDKEVSRKYDALSSYGVSKRHTYVIDRQGIVRKIYTEVDVSRHPEEVVRFVRENLREE